MPRQARIHNMTMHRGPQFYANGSDVRKGGESAYEKRLVELDIRHILARVKHPQTNGRLELFHGEMRRKMHRFEASSHAGAAGNPGSVHVGGPFHTEPPKPALERFMERYNYGRAHVSPDRGHGETPAQAFMRRMAPAGEVWPSKIGHAERKRGSVLQSGDWERSVDLAGRRLFPRFG